MSFIEFEKSIKEQAWSMTDLHSHSHYEVYYLVSGQRKFFLKDRMFSIVAPCIIIIPPYTMHKTEGERFTRINVNVSEEFMNEYEKSVINKTEVEIFPLNSSDADFFLKLFEEGISSNSLENKFSKEKQKIIFDYILYNIEKTNKANSVSYVKSNSEKVSPVVLKIIDYLSLNYQKNITLTELSNMFYISTVSICNNFKKTMNCTVNEYLTRIRLNKAKELLTTTKKSVEEISEFCGFSSAQYMGLVFKTKLGLSPLNYKKLEKNK